VDTEQSEEHTQKERYQATFVTYSSGGIVILVEKGIVDDAATFYANSGFVVNFSPTVFAKHNQIRL